MLIKEESSKKSSDTNLDKMFHWKKKYDNSRMHYESKINTCDKYYNLYKGSTTIFDNKGYASKERASAVRNIVAEIIDSAIDNNIPTPKINSCDQSKEHLAHIVEEFINNELTRIPINEINDVNERITPIMGADYFLVEWDNEIFTHTTVGGIKISRLPPTKVIPQLGVKNVDEMEYIFYITNPSKQYIKRKFNIDIAHEILDTTEVAEMINCFYKTKKNKIGKISWIGETLIEDFPNYYERLINVCKKCGIPGEKICKKCGSDKFSKKIQKSIVLEQDILDINGKVKIPAVQTKKIINENGIPVMAKVRTKVPVYSFNHFPIVLRKNIGLDGHLLGESDVSRIKDQQNMIKKRETRIAEKLDSAGSIISLPRGLKIDTDNREAKVVYFDNPQQIQGIQALNMQIDTTMDVNHINYAYQSARNVCGITDTLQGRYDPTATSGRAREQATYQSLGRLESKKVLKGAAYKRIFELIFKLSLSFADEPRKISYEDKQGHRQFAYFNKFDFLDIDEAGEIFWNDEFIFDVDSTASLAKNKQAMWQETRMNFETGSFGNPQDPRNTLLFWQIMEKLHYPKAGEIRTHLEEIIKQSEQENQQISQLQQQLQQTQQQAQSQIQQLQQQSQMQMKELQHEADMQIKQRGIQIQELQQQLGHTKKFYENELERAKIEYKDTLKEKTNTFSRDSENMRIELNQALSEITRLKKIEAKFKNLELEIKNNQQQLDAELKTQEIESIKIDNQLKIQTPIDVGGENN